MAIAVTKDQKQQAKDEGKYLIQISIDGRHLTKEQVAGMKAADKYDQRACVSMTGPMSPEAADELYKWFRKWVIRKGEPDDK